MRFIRRAILVIGLIGATIFLWKAESFVAYKLIAELDPAYISATLGAFFGAFIAFIFLGIEKIFTHHYQRHKRHRDALVKHERIINEYFTFNQDNIFTIQELIRSIKNDGIGIANFFQLPVDKSILIDLANLDYLNDAFSLNVEIYKLNFSFDNIHSEYVQLKGYLLETKIDANNFFTIMRQVFLPQLQGLEKRLASFDEECEIIFAKNKSLFEISESSFDWIFKFFSPTAYYPKGFSELVEERRTQIRLDREVSRSRAAG